jgi:Sulfotransferase family
VQTGRLEASPPGPAELYERIDTLLRLRAEAFPRREEPTWSQLHSALGEAAANLHERAAADPAVAPAPDEAFLARPVFVVGYPKSGTTLLLGLLDGHPQLVVVPGETRWFTDPEPTLRELHERWIRYLVNPSGQEPFWLLGRPDGDGDPYLAFTARLLAAAEQRDLLTALVAAFWTPGARAWVEKTPLHVFQVDRIRRRFPAARFVHVVRDPQATVAAIRRFARHGWRTDVDETLGGVTRALVQAREAASDTYLVVRYEDVVAAPERELRRVADFVGVDWSDSLLRPTLAGVPMRANSAWLDRRVVGEIHDRSLDNELDPRTLALVHARTSRAARALGYDLPRVKRVQAVRIEVAERARRVADARRPNSSSTRD